MLLQPGAPRRVEREPEIPALPPIKAEESPGAAAKWRWRPQFEFDEMDRSVVFNDCRFANAERGIAVGLVTNQRNGSTDGYGLLTRNGGGQWTPFKVKDGPLSVHWGAGSTLWMVGEEDLWYSPEAGLTWEKRKLPSAGRMIRCHFVDENRGWVYGLGKQFFSTEDGGRRWQKVPESEDLDLKTEHTSWSAMQFISADVGLLLGNYTPPRRERQRFPDWMNPDEALKRRLTPTTTLAAETRDGGKSWKIQKASAFGTVVRLRTLGARGLIVYHYSNSFDFPSEVMEADFTTGKSRPVFRRRDTLVYDAVPLPGGGAVLAGLTVQPSMAFSPVSRPATVLWSDNLSDWTKQKVHYRAAGRRVVLSYISSTHIWCATDEGMILRLIREA